jgi:membrane protease YdiL (CAAX protease family)
MPEYVTILILAGVVMLGLAVAVWTLLPAFQGAEAARRDLGTHRLEFGGWLTALVLIGLFAVPVSLLLHVGPELTLGTFVVSALATDIPLLIFIYVRLIMPGALTWTELGLKPLPLGYTLSFGLTAGVLGLLVIGAIGGLLSQVGLATNQLEQFRFVLEEGPLALVVFLLVAAVVAPFVEELFFRGFLFGVYCRRQPVWLAYLVSSLLFTILHLEPGRMNASQMAGLSVGIFLLALMLAWLYRHTGSLYPGMIAHAVNNAAAALLFYSFGIQ